MLLKTDNLNLSGNFSSKFIAQTPRLDATLNISSLDLSSFPVSYEVIKKEIKFCDIESKKEKRKSSINKNELFRKLVI